MQEPSLPSICTAFIIALGSLTCGAEPSVGPPPESFFQLVDPKDRDAAREFYGKYIDVDGMPAVASPEVDDRALLRTHEIVSHMLAGRPDVVQALVETQMYLIIIGRDQVYTDMPENRHAPNPDYLNERVRGTGGRPTSFGEENLLSLPIDRYDDESIGVHEFAHTIDGTLNRIDPEWRSKLRQTYRAAIDQGLYQHAYAASNSAEYWAEIVQAYFDCNRVNNWNHGPIGTREQLRAYDPAGYELVRTTLRLQPSQDWRYAWLQALPKVTPPPQEFAIDPWYTQFTYARELPVVGRGASEAALLKANDTIRKLFAYRHDILKAFISDGAKLVVLGKQENVADLPEFRNLHDPEIDLLARVQDYRNDTKTFVVSEENVLSDPSDPLAGDSQILTVFAKAIVTQLATRAIDPSWDQRQDVQQYELRVRRIDTDFRQQLDHLYQTALRAGRWKGTAAQPDPIAYWTTGVLAYFDAAGQTAAPLDAPHPIRSRESLAHYDADLHQLVATTMAYEGHVDWRFHPTPAANDLAR
ncbi:hypothetical protein HNR46_003406 [Haloferula luteola]|uniref:Uncharacterized protein n=1 Tax=Haloferula luteola TaxID=595692 RepID=A0A840V5A7_9BACT|nr:hypothetical protein [Haloferula luteola]MBB5353152.1 hypothetical protein [Haloferula luteola]